MCSHCRVPRGSEVGAQNVAERPPYVLAGELVVVRNRNLPHGLNAKQNCLKRNGAVSRNPRAGSIARDHRGSEPGTRRTLGTEAVTCLTTCRCFSRQLSQSSLPLQTSYFPNPTKSSAPGAHLRLEVRDLSCSSQSMNHLPQGGVSILVQPAEAKGLTQVL